MAREHGRTVTLPLTTMAAAAALVLAPASGVASAVTSSNHTGTDVAHLDAISAGPVGALPLTDEGNGSIGQTDVTNEVLGSGFQAGGAAGFFTIDATGSGTSATGSFTYYQSNWPEASSSKSKLRTATVTCVTYGTGDEATVTGTVTSGADTETVVAQVLGGTLLRFSFAPYITEDSPGCDTPVEAPVPIASGDIETGPPFSLSSGEVLASGYQAGGPHGLFAIDTAGTGNTATGNFTFYEGTWPTPSTPATLRTADVTCVAIDGPIATITGKVTSGSDTETVVAQAVAGNEDLRLSFKGGIAKVSKGCDEPDYGPVAIASGDIEIGS